MRAKQSARNCLGEGFVLKPESVGLNTEYAIHPFYEALERIGADLLRWDGRLPLPSAPWPFRHVPLPPQSKTHEQWLSFFAKVYRNGAMGHAPMPLTPRDVRELEDFYEEDVD